MPVAFDFVPGGAVASAVFLENKYKKGKNSSNFIPQRIALLAQHLAAKSPTEQIAYPVTDADEVAAVAGYGSEAHYMALKLFGAMGATPALVDLYNLAAGTTEATGTIVFATTATSAGTWTIKIGSRRFTFGVASGDTASVQGDALAAVINGDVNFPVTAVNTTGSVALTSKWKGESANGIVLAKVTTGQEPGASTCTVTTMASGAGDPTVATALAAFGTTRYTWVLTPYNTDTTADLIETAGDARINPLVKKPFISVMGYTGTRANFITALASRNSPWTCLFPVEGSPNHPGEIAASLVGVCAVSANADPNRPYKTLKLTGIEAGTGTPWTWAQQDAVEVLGGSTFDVVEGAVYVHDLLTTYTTNASAAPDTSWRYVETVTNTQAKLYDLDLMLLSEPFDRAVIVDNAAQTDLEYALSPVKIKAYFLARFDFWTERAWSFMRQLMVDSLVVEINATNPGRIDVEFTDYVTSGLRIIAVRRNWSFAA